MNALLFVNCFNYNVVFYCSMPCVTVPLNQYDDDDDDNDDADDDDEILRRTTQPADDVSWLVTQRHRGETATWIQLPLGRGVGLD